MRILLFGKDGQVGWELQRSLALLGELVALERDSREHCGDLTDLAGLAATVRAVHPQVIVNAAAYTAVDRAESETDLARRVNAEAPAVLAREAGAIGAWLVHYSTDYVYDGSGTRPWREGDTPAPLGTYGQTKLEGDRAVGSIARHLILRTSWVYSARGGNFARTMLRLAAERDALSVVADQVGAPTSAELLADVTAHLLRSATGAQHLAGLYHVAAAGETSFHGYARHVLERARGHGRALRTGPDQVKAIASADFPLPARRPLNSRLDTTRLTSTFGLTLPDWRWHLDRVIAEWCD